MIHNSIKTTLSFFAIIALLGLSCCHKKTKQKASFNVVHIPSYTTSAKTEFILDLPSAGSFNENMVQETNKPNTQQNMQPKTYNARHRNKQNLYQLTVEEYAPAFALFDTINLPDTNKALKDQVMLHNETHNKSKSSSAFSARHKNRPYIQYKYLLDKRIDQLTRLAETLHKKTDAQASLHEANIQALIAQLERLIIIIITTNEYHQEKITLEQDNLPIPLQILQFGATSVAGKLIVL